MTKQQVTDQTVLDNIARILSSSYPYAAKYEMLDALWFTVENYHDAGVAADVLEKISEAQNAILFPKGGDA